MHARACLLQWATMAPRLRLFVKKRGQRRTGSRWHGTLGEAVLDVALLAIGAARPVLAARPRAPGRRRRRTAGGLVGDGDSDRADRSTARPAWSVLVWQKLASTERRAAVVQMATDWELPGMGRTAGSARAARRAADRRRHRQPRRATGVSAADRRGLGPGVVHAWPPSASSGTRWSPASSFRSFASTWRASRIGCSPG